MKYEAGIVKNNFQISLQRHDERCISLVPHMIQPCVQLALECRVIYRLIFIFRFVRMHVKI